MQSTQYIKGKCFRQGVILVVSLLICQAETQARLALAVNGRARTAVYTQPGATAPELRAARELTNLLYQLTGAPFALHQDQTEAPSRAIVIGQGPIASALFPDIPFSQLGQEEVVIRTQNGRLLLAGGRPRGTLYAVSRFLQDECGARWWTPWASRIPKRPYLTIPELNQRLQPAFESRDPFWYMAFDGDWAVRNFSNSQNAHIPEEMGGSIQYKGFVHTFYPLVPPEKHFKDHPEWFSLIGTNRTTKNAQLCLTNPKLRDFVVEQVRLWLKESPNARIISVSQNDWHGACQCPNCKAIDDAEGSPSGSLLTFVNYVAEKIGPEFPQVAIDTLAYQYTRKAPKTIKPLPNVIVRLCSIECNFGVPLTDPANSAFAKDIRDWSKLCQRLYIWDYTTDFAHYVQPHPNWYSLGPNVRFFHEHNVRGLFEQGAYQSHGGEMAEMRSWVLAQLLWNPNQSDRELIQQFLEGYYGNAAAKFIRQYMDLLYKASRGHNLTCYSKTDAPFLKFETLNQAELLWQKAEQTVKSNPELLWRVRMSHLPLQYVWLSQWVKLREECQKLGAKWPINDSRKVVAEEFLTQANGAGPKGWKKITHLSESGLSPETFVARFAQDPAPKNGKP